jgi:FMN-dependent NADH-azoreductase
MSKILIVNSSPRGERSITRRLTAQFKQQWEQAHSGAAVISRDLAAQPVPPVTEAWIIGAFAPPEAHTPEAKAALGVSDQLVDELLSADRYVFGVPMYNFNVPSTLKSYIDQVVRVGRTFRIGSTGVEGLAKDKKAIFITSSGGSFQAGSPYAPYNFQEPYLRAIFGFLGITDIQFVVADSQNLGEPAAQASVAKAEAALKELATSW